MTDPYSDSYPPSLWEDNDGDGDDEAPVSEAWESAETGAEPMPTPPVPAKKARQTA